MKVLFTLDTLANAGTEKSTLDILSKFSGAIDVKVVHFFPGSDLKEDYEKAGIPLIYLGLNGKRAFVSGVLKLRQVIKKEQPDIVVSSILRANLISRIACKITGVKVIGTFVNDSYGAIRIEEMKKKGMYVGFRIFWLLDRLTAGIPKYWISNAKSIALSNAKALHIAPGKTKIIYRGRDTSNLRAWMPLEKTNTFKFVFIGRLLERKGLSELLDAMHAIKAKHANIRLDIFGEGDFRKKIESKILDMDLHNHVQLHGKVPNGWQQLYHADCFVFPSWYEGFSGALVEAMMSGIPIIASDIPMNLEAVNKQTALLFPVKNVARLTEEMDYMITHYSSMIEMGKLARQKALQQFDINAIAYEYESFLKSVITKKVDTAELI